MIKRETLKSIVATNAVAKPIINRFGIGGITLVYHNCGKRIEFSNNVLNMLGILNTLKLIIQMNIYY